MSVHVAFDIYPAATPNGTRLVRLLTSGSGTKQAVELSCRKVLHGSGEGMIRIHSSHAGATTANFAKRNYVKVVIVNGATETEWFGFFLEQGDFGAISRSERAGRMLTFSGPGSLYYLDRALLLAEIYAPGQPRRGNLVIDGQWGWNDVPYGAILVRALEEGIYAPGSPLADATADFTRDDDSDGNPWPNIDNEYIVPWGTSVYEVVASFIRLGLIVTVDPDLTFHAWQSYGTNRTSATFAAGKVRFEHGVNIGNEVTRQIRASLERSHIFVTGDEFTSTVVDGGSSAVTYYDTLPRQETNDPATLTAAGERDLTQREIQADAAFPVRVVIDDDELNGLYVPGEHYDVGDIVTIDTVPPSGASGDHDYVNFAIEVAAIKLEHDDAGNWFAVNELGAQYLTAQLSAFEVQSNRVINQIELCRVPTAVDPSAVDDGLYGSNTQPATNTVPAGVNAVAVWFITEDDTSASVSWDGVAMTLVPGSEVTQTSVIPARTDHTRGGWYIATNVTPGVGQTLTYTGIGYWELVWLIDFQEVSAVATAIGTSVNPAVTVASDGGYPLAGMGAWGGTNGADPTVAAPATEVGDTFQNLPTGEGVLDIGVAEGDVSTTWTLAGSVPWVASILSLIAAGAAGGDAGPADTVLQGEETHGTSIRATRCDHAHAHGLLCDHGTHYHEADQIHGTTDHDHTGAGDGGDLDAPLIDGYAAFNEEAAPGSAASATVRLYAKSDGLLYSKDDAGTETLVSGGAGGLTDHDHTGGGDGGDLDSPIIDGYAVFNEESAPSSAASGTVRVYAKTDGLMYSKDDAGTETALGSGGGGGITHSYIGYDTIGGSTENIVDLRQYMKQVTTASDGLLASIGVYVKQITAGLIFACRVAVLTDSSGAPDDIIAQGPGPNDGLFLSNSNASAGDARWLHSPVGVWLPAGTYWLAVMFHPQSAASHNIYYDGSGADRYFTNGGWRITDSGWTSVTTSSNKYSIRGSLIS